MNDSLRKFATTRWSVVVRATDPSNEEAHAAMQELCESYWQPLYSFVRGKGYGANEAADLTQGFFVHLLEKKVLEKTSQHRGKFRSFLLACIQNFLNNEFDKNNAVKRGGRITKLSLDMVDAELRFALHSKEPSPEVVFEKEWANSLLNRVNDRMQVAENAQRAEFEYSLNKFLTTEPTENSYDEIATEFGMTRVAVRVAVFRLREKFRKILREEVAQTITDADSIEEEISHLLDVLTSS